jgi:hypothetical protein
MDELLSRMKHKHGRVIDGKQHYWDVEKLWELAKNLPVHTIKLDAIKELDQDCWFTGSRNTPVPTIRNVALHCRRIIDANMAYPVLLCSDGQLIDGGHRIAKAFIDGISEIDAVYITLPKADVIQ